MSKKAWFHKLTEHTSLGYWKFMLFTRSHYTTETWHMVCCKSCKNHMLHIREVCRRYFRALLWKITSTFHRRMHQHIL